MEVKGPDPSLVKEVPNYSVQVGFVDNFGEQDLDFKLNRVSYSNYPDLCLKSHLFEQLIPESDMNPSA